MATLWLLVTLAYVSITHIPSGHCCGAGVGGAAAGRAVGGSIVGTFGGKCLYIDANVRMSDGSMKRVKDLQIGDEVLAYNEAQGIHPSRIFGELHYDNETMMKLVEIETSSGRRIPVTPAHTVFVRQCLSDGTNWLTKSAYEVEVGECVPRYYTDDGDVVEESVVNVRLFDGVGVRQPVTETGTIIVDDVVVSCYDRVINQDATHFALFPHRWLVRITQKYTTHFESLLPNLLNWIGFDTSLI